MNNTRLHEIRRLLDTLKATLNYPPLPKPEYSGHYQSLPDVSIYLSGLYSENNSAIEEYLRRFSLNPTSIDQDLQPISSALVGLRIDAALSLFSGIATKLEAPLEIEEEPLEIIDWALTSYWEHGGRDYAARKLLIEWHGIG